MLPGNKRKSLAASDHLKGCPTQQLSTQHLKKEISTFRKICFKILLLLREKFINIPHNSWNLEIIMDEIIKRDKRELAVLLENVFKCRYGETNLSVKSYF